MGLTKRLALQQLTIITVATGKLRAYLEALPEDAWRPKGPRERALAQSLAEQLAVLQQGDDDPDAWWDIIKVWLDFPSPAEGLEHVVLHTVGKGPEQKAYLPEILLHVLKVKERDWTQTQKIRVHRILVRHGWQKRLEPRHADGSTRREYWVPPVNTAASVI